MNLKLESYKNVNFVKVAHIKYRNRDQMFQHKQGYFLTFCEAEPHKRTPLNSAEMKCEIS